MYYLLALAMIVSYDQAKKLLADHDTPLPAANGQDEILVDLQHCRIAIEAIIEPKQRPDGHDLIIRAYLPTQRLELPTLFEKRVTNLEAYFKEFLHGTTEQAEEPLIQVRKH